MPSLRPHQSSSVHLQPLIESQDLLRVKFYTGLVQDLTSGSTQYSMIKNPSENQFIFITKMI
jgi:hypothetical protein